MKTLFIDFDGVLHDGLAAEDAAGLDLNDLLQHSRCFVWVQDLANVLHGHDVELVVHSNWRLTGAITEDHLRHFLGPMAGRYCGTTPAIKSLNLWPTQRWESIRQYVGENDVTEFRILDDAHHEFPKALPELIICDPATGVSAPAVRVQLNEWLST